MIKYPGNTSLTKLLQLIKSKFDSLSTVARTGNYNDLINKPDSATIVRGDVTISTYTASDVSIPISITSVESLTVYYNGLLLLRGTHYSATTSSITLIGYTAEQGDIFTFIGTSVAPIALNAAATQVTFSDPVNFGSCNNVYEALEHIADNENSIESLISSQNTILENHDSKLDIVAMLAAEASFRAKVNSTVMYYEFDYFCIELFDTSIDIDTTVDDGASIISSYYDSDRHLIDKRSTGTATIQSRTFSVDSIPYDAWIYADYDGTGTVSLSISKNGGTDWIAVAHDTLTPLNVLVQKNIRVKVVMSGQVRLKNIAWGIK